MPNFNKKIIPIQAPWNFELTSKNTLRLHDHGLIRLFNIDVKRNSESFNKSIFFQSLISTEFYQELFFDHFSQSSKGRHGPFLVNNIKPTQFTKQLNISFANDLLKILSTPKWGCPPISNLILDKIKSALPSLINEQSLIFFLDKCKSFNESSEESKIYEHEWSHNLTSFYEFIIFNPDVRKLHIIILTYE